MTELLNSHSIDNPNNNLPNFILASSLLQNAGLVPPTRVVNIGTISDDDDEDDTAMLNNFSGTLMNFQFTLKHIGDDIKSGEKQNSRLETAEQPPPQSASSSSSSSSSDNTKDTQLEAKIIAEQLKKFNQHNHSIHSFSVVQTPCESKFRQALLCRQGRNFGEASIIYVKIAKEMNDFPWDSDAAWVTWVYAHRVAESAIFGQVLTAHDVTSYKKAIELLDMLRELHKKSCTRPACTTNHEITLLKAWMLYSNREYQESLKVLEEKQFVEKMAMNCQKRYLLRALNFREMNLQESRFEALRGWRDHASIGSRQASFAFVQSPVLYHRKLFNFSYNEEITDCIHKRSEYSDSQLDGVLKRIAAETDDMKRAPDVAWLVSALQEYLKYSDQSHPSRKNWDFKIAMAYHADKKYSMAIKHLKMALNEAANMSVVRADSALLIPNARGYVGPFWTKEDKQSFEHDVKGQLGVDHLSNKEYKQALEHLLNAVEYKNTASRQWNIHLCYKGLNDIPNTIAALREYKRLKQDDPAEVAKANEKLEPLLKALKEKMDKERADAERSRKRKAAESDAFDISEFDITTLLEHPATDSTTTAVKAGGSPRVVEPISTRKRRKTNSAAGQTELNFPPVSSSSSSSAAASAWQKQHLQTKLALSVIYKELSGLKSIATDAAKHVAYQCIICNDNKRSVRFNCGHVDCCSSCTEKLPNNQCPTCRTKITQKLTVLFS